MSFIKKAPNCDLCRHKKDCLFSLLDKPAQKEWKEVRTADHFKPGEMVLEEGQRPQGVYVVCSGKAKVVKSTPMGQQLITRINAPGGILGYRAFFAKEPYTSSAMVMQDTTVSFITGEAFYKFLKSYPLATQVLLQRLAKDLRFGEDKARDIAFKPARSRIAELLVTYAEPVNSHKELKGIKRKELAEMAGLTLETTVRLLSELEQKGFIRREQDRLVVLDEEKLIQIAGHPLGALPATLHGK